MVNVTAAKISSLLSSCHMLTWDLSQSTALQILFFLFLFPHIFFSNVYPSPAVLEAKNPGGHFFTALYLIKTSDTQK